MLELVPVKGLNSDVVTGTATRGEGPGVKPFVRLEIADGIELAIALPADGMRLVAPCAACAAETVSASVNPGSLYIGKSLEDVSSVCGVWMS